MPLDQPRELTEHERSVAVNSLHSAARTYRELAVKTDVVSQGLVDKFIRQAHEAEYLADILEGADKITIS